MGIERMTRAIVRHWILLLALNCFACHAAGQYIPSRQSASQKLTVVSGEKVGYALYQRTSGTNSHRPLIVLIGGSEGGYGLSGSPIVGQFLDRGYNVASLAYFAFDGGPRILSLVDVGTVDHTIRSLAQDLHGVPTCIGILGVSKGAELALVLAAYTDTADAYVATAPSHVSWQSSNVTTTIKSSWTLNGEPLAFVRYPWFSLDTLRAARDTDIALALHKRALRRTDAVARAILPVERSGAPILLQSAIRDQVWPSAEMADAIIERADQLAPGHHQITQRAYDLDHFVLRDKVAAKDAIDFLDRSLSQRCGAGPVSR